MSFDSQKTQEDLVACSSIYSSKKIVINEIKVENLVLNMFIANFSEEPVGKRFFDFFWF